MCVCVCVQDVGMGDGAVTSFLGCCVSLLQVLMEVTERLNLIGSPLSFLRPSVSTETPPRRLSSLSASCAAALSAFCSLVPPSLFPLLF